MRQAYYYLLTPIQARTLAELYYGLPPRRYKGRKLCRLPRILANLHSKGFVTQDGHITTKGIRELAIYCALRARSQK